MKSSTTPTTKTTTTTMKGITNKFFQNWANTFSCRPELYFEPENLDELRSVLKQANEKGRKVRVVGVGHSPSSLACTSEYMISLRKMNGLIEIDKENLQVKVEAGIMMDKLNQVLEKNGMALSVLGSISDQTIAGAISVAYHGTGIKYNVLSAYVLEVEVMLASGEMRTYSASKSLAKSKKNKKDEDEDENENADDDNNEFNAIVCSLGCLGVIVSVKLQCEKAFRLEQIEVGAKLEDVLQSLDVYAKSSDHFRMFWYPHTEFAVCYSATRTDKPIKPKQSSWFMDRFVGYYLLEFLYWIGIYFSFIIPLVNYFYYKLAADRKDSVDVSYKMFNFDCLFKQYAYESAIPIKETAHYLLKLKSWLDNNPSIRVHFGVEIRFVKADKIWLSPCYEQDSCYLNILMFKPYGIDYPREKWWKFNEELVIECRGRPHWAKSHNFTRDKFVELYPRFEDFDKLRKQLDPTDMFINDCLRPVFYSK